MGTLWDNRFLRDKKALEQWLYGKQSLQGPTRKWFINEAKTWENMPLLLDAGCGGGVTAYQMQQNKMLDNIKYIGIDFSDCMLELAKEKVQHTNVTWKKLSLENLPFVNKFDKILLRAVLAHVIDPEPIIKSMANALKDDGTLYIIFWNNPNKGKSIINKLKAGFYDNAHSQQILENFINKYGLKIVERHKIKEKSAREDHRIIWKIKKESNA
jgi:SAM-dependent methyltransferase